MATKHWRLASGVAAALFILAACETYDPPPFNPRALEYPEESASTANPPAEMLPMPTTMESPYLPSRMGDPGPTTIPATIPGINAPITVHPVVRMSLRELMQLAAMNNLTARVAGYQPAVDATRITEAQANFDPTYYAQAQYQHQDVLGPSPQQPTLDPLTSPVKFDADAVETGFKQNLTNGGQAQISYLMNRASREPLPITVPPTVNPFYSSELKLQITQPLLQNFGADANQARILLARNTHKISLLDFRLAMEKSAADLEEAYWQLAHAVRDVEIQEQLLQRTKETADLLLRRRGQDASNVEISQANSQLAARLAQLIQARSDVGRYSDRVKSLVNDPQMPVSGPLVILPADAPLEEPIHFDVADQIRTAMTYRPELAEQMLKIDSAAITVRAAKNNMLPQLNLQADGGVEGDGHTWGSALRSNDRAELFEYSVGIQFQVPLGNRQAKAIYQRTVLQRQQAVTQYQALVAQLSDEVKDALRNVTTAWNQIVSNRQARFAAETALQYINQKEPSVTLSPPFVETKLQLQSDLANAQHAELDAIINYNVAISALERAKGTILPYNDIILAQEAQPYPGRGKR